jgi:hypothetical protein
LTKLSLLKLKNKYEIFSFHSITFIRPFLCFSVLRPRAGRFWTTEVAKQTKENIYKIHLFMKFSFLKLYCECKGIVMFFWLFYLYSFLSISFVDRWSRSNFCFFTSIQHAKTTLFLKACLFSPWLAGRFHNFELTQKREKTRNGLRLKFAGLMIFDSYSPWNWKRLNMALKLWLSAGVFVTLTTHLVVGIPYVPVWYLVLTKQSCRYTLLKNGWKCWYGHDLESATSVYFSPLRWLIKSLNWKSFSRKWLI